MASNWIFNNLSGLRGEEDRLVTAIEPSFGGYQLLGDSLFVRFSNRILHMTDRYIDGARTIGYCISGQRIDQLRQKVKAKYYLLSSKVMILIGTNDVLCGGEIKQMMKHFYRLLRLLKSCTHILILTLPPIPKLSVSSYHWTLVTQYNNFLKSLQDEDTRIRVIDISPLYIKCPFLLEYKVPMALVMWRKRRRKVMSKPTTPTKEKTFSDVDSDYPKTTEESLSVESAFSSSEGSPLTEHRYISLGNRRKIVSLVSDKKRKLKPNSHGSAKATVSPKSCISPSYKEKITNWCKNYISPKVLPTGTLDTPIQRQKLLSERTVRMESARPRHVKAARIESKVAATDHWNIAPDDSDEEESYHVFQSQDETCYEDLSSDETVETPKSGQSDFARYVESMNSSCSSPVSRLQPSPDRGWCKKKMQDSESDSSVTSAEETKKHQMTPYVDRRFMNMLRQRGHDLANHRMSVGSGCPSTPEMVGLVRNMTQSPAYAAPTPPPLPSLTFSPNNSTWTMSRLSGLGERDRSIVELSSELCHLEFYEIFYFNNRMDMIHLNLRGMEKLNYFLRSLELD